MRLSKRSLLQILYISKVTSNKLSEQFVYNHVFPVINLSLNQMQLCWTCIQSVCAVKSDFYSASLWVPSYKIMLTYDIWRHLEINDGHRFPYWKHCCNKGPQLGTLEFLGPHFLYSGRRMHEKSEQQLSNVGHLILIFRFYVTHVSLHWF